MDLNGIITGQGCHKLPMIVSFGEGKVGNEVSRRVSPLQPLQLAAINHFKDGKGADPTVADVDEPSVRMNVNVGLLLRYRRGAVPDFRTSCHRLNQSQLTGRLVNGKYIHDRLTFVGQVYRVCSGI